MDIRERLSQEIKNSGLSNTEIAKQLGVSQSIISKYRNMQKRPTLDTFAKLCKILDVSADYILGLSDF